VSDETSTLWDLAKSGWFIALATATWGVILRVLVGRRETAARRMEDRFTNIESDIDAMKKDISLISGVLQERDRNGRHTWPRVHE